MTCIIERELRTINTSIKTLRMVENIANRQLEKSKNTKKQKKLLFVLFLKFQLLNFKEKNKRP